MIICREVIRHIMTCKEEICRKLWQEYNKIIKSDQKIELLVDEDGLLPFSY